MKQIIKDGWKNLQLPYKWVIKKRFNCFVTYVPGKTLIKLDYCCFLEFSKVSFIENTLSWLISTWKKYFVYLFNVTTLHTVTGVSVTSVSKLYSNLKMFWSRNLLIIDSIVTQVIFSFIKKLSEVKKWDGKCKIVVRSILNQQILQKTSL